jgi:hypothetical protein
MLAAVIVLRGYACQCCNFVPPNLAQLRQISHQAGCRHEPYTLDQAQTGSFITVQVFGALTDQPSPGQVEAFTDPGKTKPLSALADRGSGIQS